MHIDAGGAGSHVGLGRVVRHVSGGGDGFLAGGKAGGRADLAVCRSARERGGA